MIETEMIEDNDIVCPYSYNQEKEEFTHNCRGHLCPKWRNYKDPDMWCGKVQKELSTGNVTITDGNDGSCRVLKEYSEEIATLRADSEAKDLIVMSILNNAEWLCSECPQRYGYCGG